MAFVDYDAGKLTLDDLKKAVQGAGYKAIEARNVW
jgi:copper chaperone CopZ